MNKPYFFIVKILLLLPLLLGFSVPATAHNIFNGGDGGSGGPLRIYNNAVTGEGEGAGSEAGEEGEEGEDAVWYENRFKKKGGDPYMN